MPAFRSEQLAATTHLFVDLVVIIARAPGLGLVEALVSQGAKVTVIARGANALGSVRARLGVTTIAADVADETAAKRISAEVRPDTLVLNSGAKPPMVGWIK